MQTRRYPRTMNEAFGPYASGPIHPMPDQSKQLADTVVILVSIVTAVVLVLAIALGWMR